MTENRPIKIGNRVVHVSRAVVVTIETEDDGQEPTPVDIKPVLPKEAQRRHN